MEYQAESSTAIHQHTDGNPRRIIRLLRDLIDERHNPAEGGVLDRLTTWRAPPVQSEPTIFEEVEVEPELEEPTEMFEEEELELVEDTSPIDDFEMEEEDEPADLWDDDEEDSWNDEFEAPDEIWNTPEEPEPQRSKRKDCIKPNKSLNLNQLNLNLVKYTREQMMSLDSISLRKELSHLNCPNIGSPRETLDAY